MKIRPATTKDAAVIAAFWGPMIRETAVTFNPVEKSGDDVAAMIAAKEAAGHGFIA